MNSGLFLFFFGFAHRAPVLDGLIVFFATYFPLLLGIIALFYLIKRGSWREFLLVFAAVASTWVLAELLKITLHTPRPETLALISPLGAYAFPSAHTALFFALAFAIHLFHEQAGHWFLFSALLIGIARIMAGVHSPIDILGGIALAYAVSFIFKKIFKIV